MSWAQVECVKCGQPMGDHAGLFVEGKPWHTACHYSVLTARLAAAEAQHEADAKLLAEHARTVRRYIARYEQERQDRQKAEARQYSVGAEHLREYAARVKERDEARQQLAAAEAERDEARERNAHISRQLVEADDAMERQRTELTTLRGLLRDIVAERRGETHAGLIRIVISPGLFEKAALEGKP